MFNRNKDTDTDVDSDTISEKVGRLTGKIVKGTKKGPGKIANKASQIKHDLAEGYRDVVPAKTKNS